MEPTDSPLPSPLPYSLRLAEKLAEPSLLDDICRHVANGGTPLDLTRTWDLRYGDVMAWLNRDAERLKQYTAALNARAEWGREVLLHELSMMSEFRTTGMFDAEGKLLPVEKWPAAAAAAVASIEFDSASGRPTSLKFSAKASDKLKAIELKGKILSMFVEKHELSGKVTLEELLVAAEKFPPSSKES